MNQATYTLRRLILQLLIVLFLYFLCRMFFMTINRSEFNLSGLKTVPFLYFYGIRFDISSILITNAVFIVFSLLPLPFTEHRYYQALLKFIFITFNCIPLLLNCIDIAYFPFIQKRMQADVNLFLTGEKGNDLFHLLPTFLAQYWYLCLLYIFLLVVLIRAYNWTTTIQRIITPSFKAFFFSLIIFVLGIGSAVIGIRGGLQRIPLDLIHAAEMADIQNIPVVLNTPFSIIKTYDRKSMTEVNYFPESQLNDCEKGIHQPSGGSFTNKPNVVVIIVESLSKNYISYFNGQSKTPFLDSLFAQSLVFSNGFANAKESIDGIPAILSSIPALQSEPFIFSPYSSNGITSFASLLATEGYNSSFFHGGSTGTMGFNSYSKLAGFDNYYGREDYNNEKDFDGDWGIWDEPFLQYMAGKLSAMQQPFVSTVFTLNTHHPFTIPEKYAARFKQPGAPILRCVQYTDMALQLFFEKIKKSPWYNNTLFILTADHTGPKASDQLQAVLDDYRIPIVFYKPDGSLKGASDKIASQLDILPSAMHLLHYPHPFFSLGNNLFDNHCDNFLVNYRTGIYKYIDTSYCYLFNGSKGIGFYNWHTDSLFQHDLTASSKISGCDDKTKKFIQVFTNTMVNNKMHVRLAGK